MHDALAESRVHASAQICSGVPQPKALKPDMPCLYRKLLIFMIQLLYHSDLHSLFRLDSGQGRVRGWLIMSPLLLKIVGQTLSHHVGQRLDCDHRIHTCAHIYTPLSTPQNPVKHSLHKNVAIHALNSSNNGTTECSCQAVSCLA